MASLFSGFLTFFFNEVHVLHGKYLNLQVVLKQNETISMKSDIKRALEGFYIKETYFQCRQIRNWRDMKNPNLNGSAISLPSDHSW